MSRSFLPFRLRRRAWMLPAAFLFACGAPAPEPGDRAASDPVAVAIATAAATTVVDPVIASGGVEPLVQVAPGTKLLGRVAEVGVEEGDRVRRGQLLARLEDADLRAAVAQAEAALEMARAQLANAETQEARMADLHRRGSVTEKSLEDASTALRVARAAVAQAEASLEAAEITLGYARIASPIDGWVTAKRVTAGDMVHPGRPLFDVVQLSQVKVAVEVGEEQVGALSPGEAATVDVGGVALGLPARVHRVVPAGDPGSRTFTVRLLVDNPGNVVKPGMFARAVFAGPPREVLLVPHEALVRRGQLEGLFVVEQGTARLRWVRRGRTFGDGVEILSGLAPGESFVSSAPPPGLADGSAVVAEES